MADTGIVRYAPVSQLTKRDVERFQELGDSATLPEVGSRMMMRMLVEESGRLENSWQKVQAGRFSYAVELIPPIGRVRMIFGDFIFAEVDLNGQDSSGPLAGFF